MLAQGLVNNPEVKELVLVFDRNLQDGFIQNWSNLNRSNKIKTFFINSNDITQVNEFLEDLDTIENFNLIIFPNPLEGERRLFKPRNLKINQKYAFVIHDLIPYVNQAEYFLTSEQKEEYLEDLNACLMSHILANSKFTKMQVKGAFPSAKVTEILGGPYKSSGFSKSINALKRYSNHFLLSINGDHPRKNAEGLIRAWSGVEENLRKKHPLVIVAGGSEGRVRTLSRLSLLLGLKINIDIFLFLEVTEPEIEWLYTNSYLNIMPSFEEGLGMPILEALARGKPSIGSNRTSLPEILGSHKAQFDPFDSENMQNCITKVLENTHLYFEILHTQSGLTDEYSWNRVAAKIISLAKKVGAS
jgi:glycosyltransferase involved in cell wall biosynthesis